MVKAKQFQTAAWITGGSVIAIALLAWYTGRVSGHVSTLSMYDIFPLFGLIAFSLMWTFYILGAASTYWHLPDALGRYFKVGGWLVLGCILLHPSIMMTNLWLDGFGLPPLSYFSAYGTTPFHQVALLFGTVSLLTFLSYELYRWFSQKAWWKYITYANIVAMFAIFIHAQALGGELALVWFKIIWWFYGITLVFAVIYSHKKKQEAAHE